MFSFLSPPSTGQEYALAPVYPSRRLGPTGQAEGGIAGDVDDNC